MCWKMKSPLHYLVFSFPKKKALFILIRCSKPLLFPTADLFLKVRKMFLVFASCLKQVFIFGPCSNMAYFFSVLDMIRDNSFCCY